MKDRSDDAEVEAIMAAVTVLAYLRRQLEALEGKLDGIVKAHETMHHEFRARSRRNDMLQLVLTALKGAWVFSSQLSMIFCAGYVWVVHDRYVQEVLGWISRVLSLR